MPVPEKQSKGIEKKCPGRPSDAAKTNIIQTAVLKLKVM